MTLAIGTWGRCGRIVIFSVSRYYAIFFLGYLFLVSFGMIRVIGAIFLKDTLASTDKENVSTMALQNKDPYFIKQIWREFKEWDLDGCGSISFREMHKKLEEKDAAKRLRSIGVVPHELQGLLALTDDGDGEVTFCEFLTCIMRLRNSNKGVDLATLLYENKKVLKRILHLGKQVDIMVE